MIYRLKRWWGRKRYMMPCEYCWATEGTLDASGEVVCNNCWKRL